MDQESEFIAYISIAILAISLTVSLKTYFLKNKNKWKKIKFGYLTKRK